MRNFTSKAGARIMGAFSLAMALFVTAAPAAASVTLGDENQVLEPGVEYIIPQHKPASGIYTPSKSGKLITQGQTNSLNLYSDPEHTVLIEESSYIALGSFAYDVTAGETIYFYNRFPMSSVPFIFYMEGEASLPLEIQRMQPTQNQGVDFTNYPEMIVTFNQDITVDTEASSAYISFKNLLTDATEKASVTLSSTSNSLTVPLYSALRPYIASGAIKPLDPFTVTVCNIKSAISGEYASFAEENGDMVFSFLCGNIPVQRTDYYCPDPFLSFWPEGTKEGILTMTFDQELGTSDKSFAEIIYGNVESENDFYIERLPVTVNGSSLSVNFTGKIRTPLTMTPNVSSTYVYPDLRIKVGGIVDKYGLPVGSDGYGKVGAFEFQPAYKLLNSVAVSSDFDPASGTPLSEVNEVNVYISGLKGISFDGFALKATSFDGEEIVTVIPMSAVTVSNATEDDAEYLFTIPEKLKNAKILEITLNNLENLDGIDHSNDVRALYGNIYATPGPGTVKSLNEFVVEYLQPISANFENADMPSLKVVSEDIDVTLGQIYAEGSQLHISLNSEITEAGEYYLTIPDGFIIYTNSGQYASAQRFKYTIEEQQTGDITFVADPAEGIVTSLPKMIKITYPDFDMIGQNYGAPKATLTINGGTSVELTDEPSEMPAEWNAVYLELPQEYTEAGTYVISVPAEYLALGDAGNVLSTAFTLTYTIEGQAEVITVEPSEGIVTSLESFTIQYPAAITANLEAPDVPAFYAGEEDASVIISQIYAESNLLHVILGRTTEEAGDYRLVIPEGFVTYTASSKAAPAQTFSYTIEERQIGDITFVTDPAEGKVSSLPKMIKVLYPDFDMIGQNYGAPKATLTINEGTPIELTDEPSEMPAEWNAVYLELPQEYTEAGTYVISVPAEYLALGDAGNVLSQAFTLTYTIGNTSGINGINAADGRYLVFNLTGAKVLDTDDASDIRNLMPGVYIVNGVKINVK